MSPHLFALKNGKAIPCPDPDEWASWLQEHGPKERRRFYDEIGDVKVSTVFLGFNHRYGPGEPLLWETMIFGGIHADYQERYTSEENARIGHVKAVALVKASGTA